ncbi:MAG TPA: S41 family peptidase [Bacteroidales bacterium]|nr:S41 family peptidase [Bacteroidales bacterium]
MKSLKKTKSRVRVLLVASILLVSVLILSAFGSRNFEIAKNLDIFASLFRELVINYVEEIDPSELTQTAIDEMLQTLDPYTTFIPESQLEDIQFMTTGRYPGIGALIASHGQYTIIAETFEGSPAHTAGLIAGDRILEISGRPVLNLSSVEVRELLVGPPGTSVEILVSRHGQTSPVSAQVTRQLVTISNVSYAGMLENGIGYILVSGFTQNAGREVRDAFNALRKNHQLNGIIIDLRGNGGGLLNEAVDVVNLFVERNQLVVSTRGRMAERNVTHRTLNDPIDTRVPLAILVDRGSASATEIVAGAIQDLDRGVIIGQRTFGKGLVQNVVPLSFNTRLKVTVARYYIPSGRSIQAVNYALRNEDGSVAMIPDSLRRAFKTENGRVVFDGGGITPDVVTPAPQLSHISQSLLNRLLIFDFASSFFYNFPDIKSIEELRITPAIYSDFLAFLSDKDYDYQTNTEMLLAELKTAAQTERKFRAIEAEFNALNNRIMHNKEEDLQTFKPEISQLLKEEIASRYFLQRGRILASLPADPEINNAMEILLNQNRYKTILTRK